MFHDIALLLVNDQNLTMGDNAAWYILLRFIMLAAYGTLGCMSWKSCPRISGFVIVSAIKYMWLYRI